MAILIVHIALLWLLVNHVEGLDHISNSFISPNSASDDIIQELDFGSRTSSPDDIQVTKVQKTPLFGSQINTTPTLKTRLERSADPILSRTSGLDGLLAFKNVEESFDSNDVELSGRMANIIQPSKTNKLVPSNGVKQTQSPVSGEGKGAPQPRSLPLQEPQETTPTPTATIATAQTSVTQSSQQNKGRQANPDIQDIITGIVKLLNGNVNVQANTAPGMGRPLRPLSTRINNRGPPRITDVPALPPDFDVPAPLPPPPLGQKPPPPSSTRMPTPYPFDVPPNNISPVQTFGNPIPISGEQIGTRPAFYRPVTMRPWNNRRPTRRPTIPSYKPLPAIPSDYISLTSEKPMEDIFNLDMGSQLQSNSQESMENTGKPTTSPEEGTTNIELEETMEMDNETAEFEKNKEKSSSKMDKHASKTTTATPTLITSADSVESTNNTSMETLNIIPSTTEENIKPTSLASTPELKKPTNSTSESPLMLESSIQDVLQTLKHDLMDTKSSSATPTEALPTILSSSDKIQNTESTMIKPSSQINNHTSTSAKQDFPYYPYRPRPGIVLDDTEFKPGGINRQPIITRPPIGQIGEIFDITVSAIQGPGGGNSGQGKPYVIPVDIENVHVGSNADLITSPVGDEGFVSIDGKRTYLNLFGDNPAPSTTSSPMVNPTIAPNNHVSGTGYAVVEHDKPKPILGSVKPTQRRPMYGRPRPSQPPVRIDTCIVGDDSTCDISQHEVCRTELGVSACHCRPGTARRKHRDPCRKIVSVLLSLRVDRLYERRVVWASELSDKDSDSYQQLSFEAERALESAMSMTPFSDEFLGSRVNSIYRGERAAGQAGVFVNLTLQLEENADTSRPNVKADIQKHLLGVITRRSNNVGNSALWVDSPPGSISNLQDLDECSSSELHDCHALAKCINIFGGFKCECSEGYRDPWSDNKHRAGRHCEQCSSQHCNNRGECKYQSGQEVCICSGNYYGTQCELDGEVLGVAIGASVAAVIIIGLTLVCLVMWSRRWSREQKAAVGSPVFGYMATATNTVKTPVVGQPPYQLTLEDRLRWAQIADVMAQANHYAPEPVTGPTRPSSAMFGYPNLSMTGTLQHGSMHGTLPPIPLPRLNLQSQMASRAASMHGMRPLDNSSSSEEEDKADLLGRNFQVPRPKSRSNASIANQSGIYYDVDYDQNDIYKSGGGIPMSTYSMGRPPYFRN
ncbi:unnamed protein product [Brassicogethes aeneus]|uniref:63 kDa sperm flagellar membrane protein n=1 Tax=Brassicogethes aeneus TaxID=1431903 RepID=A0A9P0FF93_BRAAE|nr:unnamed protein product [Brassicogethes aeneus]